MGFYWGECNPSFKYHSAKADGAPGSVGAAIEGERRGGVRGARSGRALTLPSKRLPLSRRPGDHLADPGSGAGGDGAGAWMEKKRRTPDNGFPAAHTAPAPWLTAPQARGGQRPAGPRWGGGLGRRGQTRSSGEPSRHISIPSFPRPDAAPGMLGALGKQTPAGRVGTSPFLQTRLGCRAPPSPGARNPPAAGTESGSPGAVLPPRAAAARQPAGLPPPGSAAGSPAIVSAREPVSPGVSNYCDMSNMYVSDITKEVRAWRSEGRNAGLSLSFRMCVTQSLFSARLIFNFL